MTSFRFENVTPGEVGPVNVWLLCYFLRLHNLQSSQKCNLKKKIKPDMVAHVFNPSALKSEAGKLPRVCGQFSLQASQGCIVRYCFKSKFHRKHIKRGMPVPGRQRHGEFKARPDCIARLCLKTITEANIYSTFPTENTILNWWIEFSLFKLIIIWFWSYCTEVTERVLLHL